MPLLWVLVPGIAHAQRFTWRALGTAGVGYNAVQADGGGNGLALSGPFMAFTPELQLAYDRPRLEQSFDYAFTLNLQFDSGFRLDPNTGLTYANRATYQAHVYVTQNVDALFGATVTQAPLNVITPGVETNPQTQAPAYAYNLQGAINEAVTKQFTENWSGTQSASFAFGLPINLPGAARQDVYAGTLGFSAAHQWNKDTGTATVSSTLAHFTAGADLTGATHVPAFDQSYTTAVASWRHVFTESWAAQLDGGGFGEVTLQSTNGAFAQPTGAATVDFTRPSVAVELTAFHAPVLNLYLAELQVVDEVALRLSVPVGRNRELTASGTAAVEHTQAVLPTGQLGDALDLWFGDAGVAWAPRRWPNFTLGARLAVTRQEASRLNNVAVPGFTRETFLLTATYGYPTAATTGPAFLSPIYRAAPVTQRDFENVELRAHPAPEGPEEGGEPGGEAPAPGR
jgi:hypothetical protein